MISKTKKAVAASIIGGLLVTGGASAFAATQTPATAGADAAAPQGLSGRPQKVHPERGAGMPQGAWKGKRDGKYQEMPARGDRGFATGKITSVDDHGFTISTRRGDVKVSWDSNTKFRNGSSNDLKKGAFVAAAGKRDGDRIDAARVYFPSKRTPSGEMGPGSSPRSLPGADHGLSDD